MIFVWIWVAGLVPSGVTLYALLRKVEVRRQEALTAATVLSTVWPAIALYALLAAATLGKVDEWTRAGTAAEPTSALPETKAGAGGTAKPVVLRGIIRLPSNESGPRPLGVGLRPSERRQLLHDDRRIT